MGRKKASIEAVKLVNELNEQAETAEVVENAGGLHLVEADPQNNCQTEDSCEVCEVCSAYPEDCLCDEWPVPKEQPKPKEPVCNPSGQIEMFKSRADYPQIKIDGRIEQVVSKTGKEGETIYRIVFSHDTHNPREIAGDLAVLSQVYCTMQLGGSIVSVKGE